MQRSILFISLVVNLTFLIIIVLRNSNQGASTKVSSYKMQDTALIGSYAQRRTNFLDRLALPMGCTVLVGENHISEGVWNELFEDKLLFNRGIYGDDIDGIEKRISKIINANPSAMFIQAGMNELLKNYEPVEIVYRYKKMLNLITTELPPENVFVISLLPVNKRFSSKYDVVNESIVSLNEKLERACDNLGLRFINLHRLFCDSGSNLSDTLSTDGINLNFQGYWVWKCEMEKYLK